LLKAVVGLSETGFRRTLVGLKRASLNDAIASSLVFQTNPRGVEARPRRRRADSGPAFQTNPRGVEAGGRSPRPLRAPRFQTNPRGVEARDELDL